MTTVRYVHWQEDGMSLGYCEDFPGYMTQGYSLAELQSNLREIYSDLTSGIVPGIRRVSELPIE